MKKLTGIVLFAGAGGVETGMVESGIEPIFSIEFDPSKPFLSGQLSDLHRLNFPGVVIRREVQAVARLKFVGFPVPDFLHASPVCSNFSIAKTNGREEQLDIDCAVAVADALAILQPRIFTLEQVPGYRGSQSWGIINAQLIADGYNLTTKKCNLADWGLPQSRDRFIVLASKEFVPTFPPMKKRVGWFESVEDLIPNMVRSQLLPAQQKAIENRQGENLLVQRSGYRDTPKVRSENQPMWTITRSVFTDQRGNSRNKFADIVLAEGECLSCNLELMARLQGFPSWYKWSGIPSVDGSGIGYSVPPMFFSQVLSHLFNQIEETKN